MSIGRLGIRICTVEALSGRTSVLENVLDSQISAIDVGADSSLRTDQEKPFISIYTEASSSAPEAGRELWMNGSVELVIESGIAASMAEVDPITDESIIVGGIPAADQAFELFLDVLDRQIVQALMDPDNKWAEVWRGLVKSISKIEMKRISDGTTGARIAAHQKVIACDLLPDPVYGQPLAETSVWRRLLDQMTAVEHPYLETLQNLIGISNADLIPSQQRRFGLTLEEARTLAGSPPYQH